MDVLADYLQVGFIADDMLIVIALPDWNFRVIQDVMRLV